MTNQILSQSENAQFSRPAGTRWGLSVYFDPELARAVNLRPEQRLPREETDRILKQLKYARRKMNAQVVGALTDEHAKLEDFVYGSSGIEMWHDVEAAARDRYGIQRREELDKIMLDSFEANKGDKQNLLALRTYRLNDLDRTRIIDLHLYVALAVDFSKAAPEHQYVPWMEFDKAVDVVTYQKTVRARCLNAEPASSALSELVSNHCNSIPELAVSDLNNIRVFARIAQARLYEWIVDGVNCSKRCE